MTINHPQPGQRLNRCIRILLVAIAGAGLFIVFSYNQSATLRREATAATEALNQLELTNAQLKNDLFALQDGRRLSQIASAQGLVKEGDPDFINLSSASAETSRQTALQY